MATLPKLLYRFNETSIKIPAGLFEETDKLILTCTWKLKGPKTAKTILKKKNETGRLTLSNFKTYYKTVVIKTAWYWC